MERQRNQYIIHRDTWRHAAGARWWAEEARTPAEDTEEHGGNTEERIEPQRTRRTRRTRRAERGGDDENEREGRRPAGGCNRA